MLLICDQIQGACKKIHRQQTDLKICYLHTIPKAVCVVRVFQICFENTFRKGHAVSATRLDSKPKHEKVPTSLFKTEEQKSKSWFTTQCIQERLRSGVSNDRWAILFYLNEKNRRDYAPSTNKRTQWKVYGFWIVCRALNVANFRYRSEVFCRISLPAECLRVVLLVHTT